MGGRLRLSRSFGFVSGLTLSLVAGLLAGLPPAAAVAQPAGVDDGYRSVPVSEVPGGVEQKQDLPVHKVPAPVWPKAGSAVVDLPLMGARGMRSPGSAVVGGLAVRVAPVVGAGGDFLSQSPTAAGAAVPGRVRVEVLDRVAASRVGAAVAVRVSRADGVAGAAKVKLEVDYSAFRHAYGADWAWRLGLVTVAPCAFAQTVTEDCAGMRRLDSRNDAKSGRISADVPVSMSAQGVAGSAGTAEPTTVAVMAAASGSETGDFTKTDLKETSSWSVGWQSGDFNWSYPMRVPPVPGGLVPDVALSYSSGAVDGQTAGRHTQPGVFGEGWSYSPGFIERTYRPCSDDSANSPYWTALNYTGDLCWRLPNASITLNGKSSQIVLGDDGTWRLEDDNGEKVELLTGAPNSDDLDNGEHWKITTTDGTQYWFGRDTLPNGKSGTNSVLTMPVFANHSGEPCFSTSSAASSRCAKQAYRWMLDYVVDRNGNEMSYWYSRHTNRAGLAGNSSSTTAYHRDVVLYRIEYGTHTSDPSTVQAPARVRFSYADRCVTTSCGTKDETNWPDTPWDLQCDLSPCGNNMSPSFWTDNRLAAVYTQVKLNGSYSTVDYWGLTHDFPSTGDGSSPVLWLEKISHEGQAGNRPDVYVPSAKFWGVRMQNRVDYDPNATMRSHNKWRVDKVLTESGRQVDVTYAPDDPGCHLHAPFPDPDQNSKRCFAQYYVPETAPPGFSWWHKRLVVKVVESDATGSSTAPVTHEYQYGLSATNTTVLWGYDAGARVWGAPAGKRSWSDWRGYTNVTVRTGKVGGLRSKTEYVYFRGLHGDRIDGSTRSVTLSAYSGTWADQAQRRGHLMNKIVYNQSGGTPAQILQYNPWTHVTGTRGLSSDWAIPGTFKSQVTRTDAVTRWEVSDSGTMSWRTGIVDTFDTRGRITHRYDKGNSGAGDSTCTRYRYAENPSKHMYAFKNREQTVNGDCDDPYTIPEDLVFDHAWRYDGGSYDADPTKGNVSKDYVYRDTAWVDLADNITYDKYGRVTSSEDAIGHTTTTAYTHNSDRLTETVKVTNDLGHQVTSALDVTRGLPLSVTDANGKVTTGTYDALGRLLSVTRPGNTTGLPDVEYYYYLSQSYRSYVRTRTLGPNGDQINSYEIFDGLLRPRQTQVVAPDWNRLITDVQYDERGLAVKKTTLYNGDAGPSAHLVTFNDANVDQQIRTIYDGRGRVTDEELWSRNVYQWETTTRYGLNWTGVMPPAGGTLTKDLFDDKGNLVQKWQYHERDYSAASDKTKYSYNVRDELTSVIDPAGNVWTYEYNLLGWKTKTTDPDAGISTFTYDVAGQLQSSTDGRGVTLDYNYDALGRKTSTYQGTTKLATWAYDIVAKGQLYGSYRWEDGLAYSKKVLATDDGYRPTSIRTTIPASTKNGALAGDYNVTMTYKVNGALASQTVPGVGGLPGETISYSYGNHGFADTITSTWAGGGSQTYVADIEYTFDGLVSQQLLGNSGKRVKLTNSFDAKTRRLELAHVYTENQTTASTFDEKDRVSPHRR